MPPGSGIVTDLSPVFSSLFIPARYTEEWTSGVPLWVRTQNRLTTDTTENRHGRSIQKTHAHLAVALAASLSHSSSHGTYADHHLCDCCQPMAQTLGRY